MSRSIWKGAYTRVPTIQSRKRAGKDSSEILKVWSRAFMVTPDDMSKIYLVYNGKRWIKVRVVEQMIGHRLGEFCNTRKTTVHKVYKQKQTHRKSTSFAVRKT